jgi:hypothetical protein
VTRLLEGGYHIQTSHGRVGLKDINATAPGVTGLFALNQNCKAIGWEMTLHIKPIIEVASGDINEIEADVLVLKYAQAFYGVDSEVASRLFQAGEKRANVKPEDGSWTLVSSRGVVAADRVLFVGVPKLYDFDYRMIRVFARRALSALATEDSTLRHIVTTLHGTGYGLDEIEALESEVAGFLDAVNTGDAPKALERISIVDRVPGKAQRLKKALDNLLEPTTRLLSGSAKDMEQVREERLRSAGYASAAKQHVFVAMPFRGDMDDLYHYGIQTAVRDAGLVCERADLSSFTGDVVSWVRERIKSAKLLVADLSEPNPNVYLEVGYAWGCGVPTVLLAKDAAALTFDVRGQRCLTYQRIQDLEESLRGELRNLMDPQDFSGNGTGVS